MQEDELQDPIPVVEILLFHGYNLKGYYPLMGKRPKSQRFFVVMVMNIGMGEDVSGGIYFSTQITQICTDSFRIYFFKPTDS
jgi:hypothetical protein